MNLPERVEIMEVCPRDGWQNHKVMIPTETKIKYIKKMIDYGAKKIDCTSFVNPKYVPQMAGAKDVVAGVKEYAAANDCKLYGLTLNGKGVENLRETGLKEALFVLSVSEEHNLRNSRKTIAESREMFRKLVADTEGLNVTLALPCVFGSPFGDKIDMELVKDIILEAFDLGVKEIGLADTAGVSNPLHTAEVLQSVKAYSDPSQYSIHLHDTRGMGLANAYVSLTEGFYKLDASAGGMGGCPFVPGAKGNIATEDLVNMCESMGIQTGYDLQAVVDMTVEMAEEIQAEVVSSVAKVCKRA